MIESAFASENSDSPRDFGRLTCTFRMERFLSQAVRFSDVSGTRCMIPLRLMRCAREASANHSQTSFCGYSDFNASVGFIAAARDAGKKLASNAAVASTAATPPSVAMSQERTSNSSARIKFVAKSEAVRPAATPIAVNCPASRMMSR